MTDTKRLTIELPADLVADLEQAAEQRVVGRTLLIEHLLRDGLDHLIPVDQFVRRHSVQSARDNRPHSRACGPIPHEHGDECHANCPTCHGRDEEA